MGTMGIVRKVIACESERCPRMLEVGDGVTRAEVVESYGGWAFVGGMVYAPSTPSAGSFSPPPDLPCQSGPGYGRDRFALGHSRRPLAESALSLVDVVLTSGVCVPNIHPIRSRHEPVFVNQSPENVPPS
jgi:hypothetical protein